ncbi:MAG: glucose-6-phosphate isomerase [Pseudomonadota bacterium]|nr:glucose-6-phosphate isomerase [Pseudomonadota bacterium]
MTLPFQHFTEACMRQVIGDGGLDPEPFADSMEQAREAVATIRGDLAEGRMPCFGITGRRDDLDGLVPLAERLRERFGRVVVLGTGGSSLGAQALMAIAPLAERRRFAWCDNLDGNAFAELLDDSDPDDTAFLVISKSGGTTETLAQLFVALEWLRAAGGGGRVATQVIAVAEPGENLLRRIAGRYGIRVLDHDPDIGGRFSVLSLVGLLPAMIAGLDARAVRIGASEVFEDMVAAEAPSALTGPVAMVQLAEMRGRTQQVLWPYAGALDRFSHWYRQLWAESLGKDGKGLTPVAALGPVDQHSQLQLWLDGPADKSFTIITCGEAGADVTVPADLATDPALDYLAGRSFGTVVRAQARGTMEALVERGHPVRLIRVPKLDEKAMGALFMQFMLETVIAAHLIGVDPFGQPAVEKGKQLTRAYLAKQ